MLSALQLLSFFALSSTWAASDTNGNEVDCFPPRSDFKTRIHRLSCQVKSSGSFKAIVHDEQNGQLIVGGRNRLYALDYHLRFTDKVVLQPHKKDVDYCRLSGHTMEHCQNYIRVVAVRGDKVLTCGTHARKPNCQYRKRDGISTVIERLPRRVQMCSEDEEERSTVQLPENSSALFVGMTSSKKMGILRYFGQPDPLTTDMNNINILRLPQFVTSYTVGSSVFFFARELINLDNLKFYISRVARVCQSDTGGKYIAKGKWTSFEKSQLTCIQPGGRGQLEYRYDYLVDASFTEKNGRRHAFAVFQPPTSGPAGGAVCLYGFDAVRLRDDIFDVFLYDSKRQIRNHCEKPARVLTNTERGRPIKQATKTPLVTKSGARLLAIAANAISDTTFVFFVASDQGTVAKYSVVIKETESRLRGYVQRQYEPSVALIDTVRVVPMADVLRCSIYTLLVVQKQNAVFVGTETDIVRLPLSRCDVQYTECGACIGSKRDTPNDPYCGWCTGTHTCSLKNDCDSGSWITKQDDVGCHGESSLVGASPAVTSIWTSYVDVSDGKSVLLNCSASGFPSPSYWWKKDGEILLKATGSEYVIPVVHAEDGGQYECLAHNKFGNTTVKTLLRVLPAINERAPAMVILGPFDPLALPCGVVGYPTPVVTWRKRGVLLTDDLNHGVFVSKLGSLVFTTLAPGDTGTYECEAVNSAGHASYTTQLDVTYDAASNFKSRIVREGNTVRLTCSLCRKSCKFAWTKDGESLEKTRTKTLTIRNARPEDTGQYRCTNAAAKNFRGEVHLVKVLAPPTVVALSPVNVTAAANASAIFYLDVRGEPPPYVRWFKKGKEVEASSRIVVTGTAGITGTTGRFSLVVGDLKLSDAGIYVAKFYNSIASKEIAFSLSVFEQRRCPPLVGSVTEGETLCFTCEYSSNFPDAVGSNLLPVTWSGPQLTTRSHSVNISRKGESTNVILTIKNVDVSNEGEYGCHAHSSQGHSSCRWWVGVAPRTRHSASSKLSSGVRKHKRFV